MTTRRLGAVVIFILLAPALGARQAPTSFHGLVVLIDFPDKLGTITVGRANNIINGIGYTEPTVTASLRDYWAQQSRGAIDIIHDVVGYYTAPHPSSYYQAEPFSAYITLLQDALDWVVDTNPSYNWNALSLASGEMNRNGTEEGKFLSVSFMTTEWIPGTGGTHWLAWTAPNGVGTQQVVGATFKSPWDTNVNLFWLTHEQGHSIWGWPDTYDYNAVSHGTGIYSVMSGNQSTGDIEPPGGPFLAEEGWVDVLDLGMFQTVTLTADGDAVARYRNPLDPREYFVIEARKQTTVGNAAFPVSVGLLIWHVDERVTTFNTKPQMTLAEHYRISIEQADGLFHLEGWGNPGDAGDIYVPGSTFGPTTTPNSHWWDGTPSHLRIDVIEIAGNGVMTFRAMTTAETPMVQNGSFGSGLNGWIAYGSPSTDVIQHNSASTGVFEFYRTAPAAGATNQAAVFQETGISLGAGVPLLAEFDLGNSSTVRKRISVLILAHDFTDLSVCTFWLGPNAPMRTYRMRTHTTQAWANAAIYFYAASVGEDGGRYRLDNASLRVDGAGSTTRTECDDPTAPAVTVAPNGADLIVNGTFDAMLAPPWETFGTIAFQQTGGRFQFYRPWPQLATDPAGVVLQRTGVPRDSGVVLTATFEIGNSSQHRQRVTAIVHDSDFSDLAACTFWLPAGQPPLPYLMRSFTTEAWTNATLSLYAATIASPITPSQYQWIEYDNVTLRRTPGVATAGTECLEPADQDVEASVGFSAAVLRR